MASKTYTRTVNFLGMWLPKIMNTRAKAKAGDYYVELPEGLRLVFYDGEYFGYYFPEGEDG